MNCQRLLVGVVALSAVALAGAPAPALVPTGLAENQDVRETKMIKLKLPAMV
jgi:hypothetical protein